VTVFGLKVMRTAELENRENGRIEDDDENEDEDDCRKHRTLTSKWGEAEKSESKMRGTWI